MNYITMLKQNTNNKKTTDELIDEGLWRAGEDKLVRIADMNAEYLQKVFYTLQSREKRLTDNYLYNIDILSRLYTKVLERSNELDHELQCNFIPMQNLPQVNELEGLSEFFQNLVHKRVTK